MNARFAIYLVGLTVLLTACGTSSVAPASDTTSVKSEPPGETSTSDSATTIDSVAPDTASEPLPTPRPRRLKPGDLRIAADEDDIPAIFAEDDLFVDAESGDLEWHEDDPIIGLVVGDDARAYPVRLLSNHEIVNDVVGGEPVVVTWCPLCFSALVFSRVVDGKELTFGVSGYLFNDNLVMYDHRTNTLWSQLIAEAIKGAYRGERLALFPSSMTSWNDWKNRFPNTRVLSAERLGLSAEEVVDPYVGYYESGIAGLTGQEETNSVLRPKALVVGVTVGDTARAYPVSDVQSLGLINDKLGGASLLVAFDNGLDSVVVYHQGVGGQQLTFSPAEEDGLLSDDQTGSLWQVSTGKAIDGPLEGQRLGRLAAPLVFWFAWSDLQPKGDVYGR